MLSPLSDSVVVSQRVDFVFYSVLLLSMAFFWAGEVFWWLKKIRGAGSKEIEKKHFEAAWSLVPLMVLLFLTCVKTQVFAPTKLRLKAIDVFQLRKDELPKDLKKKRLTPVARM
ncbi:MAG: hypothetical protein EBR01_02760 [Proteobacteria bacterium]|nr:hypothetical protein [Pseudomonadota bacterium]NBY19014.1 hypothetical protein [bacterium]